MDRTDGFPSREDDGLLHENIGAWAEEKYKLVEAYASLFCKAIRESWDSLVYLDLFSGPGRSKIDNKRIIDAPPLLILNSDCNFDKYIFNDIDKNKSQALKKRVSQYSNNANICVMNEDINLTAHKIIEEIPRYSIKNKVLGFCFIDPYSIENLRFATIEALAARFIDFLILIPTGMDINRNAAIYEDPSSKKIENFLGNPNWREEWNKNEQALSKHKTTKNNFGDFVAEQFSESMKKLRYIDPGIEKTKLIRSDAKNLPLYRLVVYSRHRLGNRFWQEVMKYTNPQQDMFD